MKRIDMIIGAVLLIAAAGSAIGAIAYEDDRVGTFRVAWPTAESELALDALTQTGGGDVDASANVTTANLTRAAWTVTVSGGAARVQPVAIRVEMVSPTNETASADGTLPIGPTASIEIPIEMDLATLPQIEIVTGPSIDAARGALNATQSSTLGVGTWTLRISIAPTAPGPLGGTESFTIQPRAMLTSYSAELTLDTPEVGGR